MPVAGVQRGGHGSYRLLGRRLENAESDRRDRITVVQLYQGRSHDWKSARAT